MTQNNLTPEQLAEAVARIAELDEKRTQGEWKTLGEWAVVGKIETIADLYQTQFDCDKLDRVASNTAFIAAAPLMAQVIRQLWAEREANRAAMVQAREAHQATISSGSFAYLDKRVSKKIMDSIAQLDAALGGCVMRKEIHLTEDNRREQFKLNSGVMIEVRGWNPNNQNPVDYKITVTVEERKATNENR